MWGQITTLQFLLEGGQALFGSLGTFCLSDVKDDMQYKACCLFRDVDGTQHARTLSDTATMANDAAVLQWLQSRNAVQFTSKTMLVAADGGAVLANLKWLRAQGCPHDIDKICQIVLDTPWTPPPVMAWVRSCGGGDWSPQGMTDMLAKALLNNTPALARWLRAEGAQWPKDLAEVVTSKADILISSNILWALQQGCPFGRWTTQVCGLLEKSHDSGGAVKRALHDLGCPCACPRPHKI
ncbi:hypothetical protein JKP88DRAFT_220095 [Tribonema minus]|uniref:Uncharacterized protein n=1 Tax=Tribonema minus TaxID=303371 RepID=A0A835Z7G5_9STRA|nr:hypothetical protein JKP88DRAFT_220095 [Tribonema minus]